MSNVRRQPVTARDYFAERGRPGRNMHAASRDAGVSYPSIHGHVSGTSELSVESANALQRWSLGLDEADYIDAAMTLGVESPARGAA